MKNAGKPRKGKSGTKLQQMSGKTTSLLDCFSRVPQNLSKVTTNEAETKRKNQFFIFASAECSKTYQKLYAILVNAKSHPEPFHPGIHRVATLN